MSDGAVSITAVVLLIVGVLFAAAAVPSLTPYSPGEGLEGVGGDVGVGEVQGPDGSSGGSTGGVEAGGGGGGSSASPSGSVSGGSDLPLPRKLLAAFSPLLDLFSGASGAASASSGDGGSATERPTVDDGSMEAAPDEEGDSRGTNTADGSSASAPTTSAGDAGDGDQSGMSGADQSRTIGAVIAGGVILLLGLYLYRSDKELLAALRALPAAIQGALLSVVFAVSSVVEQAVAALSRVTSITEVPGVLLGLLLAQLRAGRERLSGATPWGASSATTAAGGSAPADEPEVSARQQIQAAWRTVAEVAVPHRYRRQTPGEVERRAIAEGLPENPVQRLADTFRAVEYGDRSPEERVDTATDAAESIQDHLEAAEDEKPADDDPEGT